MGKKTIIQQSENTTVIFRFVLWATWNHTQSKTKAAFSHYEVLNDCKLWVVMNHYFKLWPPHTLISCDWPPALATRLDVSLHHTMSWPSSDISPVLAVTFAPLRQTRALSCPLFYTPCCLSLPWEQKHAAAAAAAESFNRCLTVWTLSVSALAPVSAEKPQKQVDLQPLLETGLS